MVARGLHKTLAGPRDCTTGLDSKQKNTTLCANALAHPYISARGKRRAGVMSHFDTVQLLLPFVRVSALANCTRMPKYQDLSTDDFSTICIAPRAPGARIPIPGLGEFTLYTDSNFKKRSVPHFISHRWLDTTHPDPDGSQLQQILDEFSHDCLVWYDYCCLPQEPRTTQNYNLLYDDGLRQNSISNCNLMVLCT